MWNKCLKALFLKCSGWGWCGTGIRITFIIPESKLLTCLKSLIGVVVEKSLWCFVPELKPLSWCWLWQTFSIKSYIFLFVFWFYASLQSVRVKLLEFPRLITFHFLYCVMEGHVMFFFPVVHGRFNQKADCITLSVFCDMVIRKSAWYVMWQSLCFQGKFKYPCEGAKVRLWMRSCAKLVTPHISTQHTQ